MSWVRLEERVYDHPALRAAGLAATGLYVQQLYYGAFYETDGKIYAAVLRWFAHGQGATIEALVRSGLWTRQETDFAFTRYDPRGDDHAKWITLGLPEDPFPLAAIVSKAWRRRTTARAIARNLLTKDLRAAVMARDGLVCGLCKTLVSTEDVHIDHIVPLAHGGRTEHGNLQVTHRACNLQKGSRLLRLVPPTPKA